MITDQQTLGGSRRAHLRLQEHRGPPGGSHPRDHRRVRPQIQAYYEHSKVKQYFKEGRALRTDTTVKAPTTSVSAGY